MKQKTAMSGLALNQMEGFNDLRIDM